MSITVPSQEVSRGGTRLGHRGFFARTTITVVLAVLVAVSPMALGGCTGSQPADNPEELKAAVIDQLFILQPNDELLRNITTTLEGYGFEVDVYQGEEVTVDLHRKLATRGYKLIIFRSHAGLLGVDPAITNRTWLFTAEEYSKTAYVYEQLTDQVTYASTFDEDSWLFAVSAKFITDSLEGEFAKTAIIMMGCDCFHFTDLAEAFIQKGASIYIAWDYSVLLDYVDGAIPVLIENLCSQGLAAGQAVATTMQQVGPDPKYQSVLHYFPQDSGAKTLDQLIR